MTDLPEGQTQQATCLNCKYEPEWGPMSGGEYPRRSGACKWDKEIPTLPSVYRMRREWVTRHRDDSGVMTNCKAWEPKAQ